MGDALVHRILAPTFVDGPGARMAVFLQGCDLACPTCHNPETRGICDACGLCLETCPRGAIQRLGAAIRHAPERCVDCGTCEAVCPPSATPRTTRMTPEALLDRVRPWIPFLDGLTFTGGEATRQADFLLAFGRLLRAHTPWTWLVDTHGDMPEATYEALAAEADGFLFDLKAVDPGMYERLTGRPMGQALSHLQRAAKLGKLAEVRLLLVPGATAEPEAFERILAFAAALPGPWPLRLQPYRHHGVRGEGLRIPEPSADAVARLADRARETLGAHRVCLSA